MGLDPNHQMTEHDIHYYELPDEIGGNWRDLARALGYKEAKIKSIETEKGNSNKECCIELLVRWLHKKGKDATAGKLAEALIGIEIKSVADRLIKPNDQSQPERLPKTPCSDTTGLSDKSKESKKVSRHTDPGARPKSRKVRAKGKPPADCDDDENEVRCNVTKRKSIFGKKEKDKHEICTPISYSSRRDS